MSNILLRDIPWSENEWRRAIRELRHLFSGYEAADGFDLRHRYPKVLSYYWRKKIQDQLAYVHDIQGGVPKRIYRTKNKKKQRQILTSQGVKHVPKNLKVAFVPDPSNTVKTKIRTVKTKKVTGYDNKKKKKVNLITMAPIETLTGPIRRRFIHIMPQYLIESPSDAIKDAIAISNADSYQIQAGAHEIHAEEYRVKPNDSEAVIIKKVAKLMQKYGAENDNNYWQNWLGGMIAYYYPDPGDYEVYRASRDSVRRANKQKNRAAVGIRRRRNKKEFIAEIKKEVSKKYEKKIKKILKRKK